jgi:hypothetical protein
MNFKHIAAVSGIIIGSASSTPGRAHADARMFDELRSKGWNEAFADTCTDNWQTQWFLDGVKAKISNDEEAMTIDTAGGYAVLWTKPSFKGDLRIEYDFKRVDENHKGVNILYIQATGDGENGCVEDISLWSDRRKKAAMSDYFLNMHTYHVSYATDRNDYIRGRRYLPLANKGLGRTALSGEQTKVGLFDDKKWIHVTVIKQSKDVWMEFKHPDKRRLCHFHNKDKPAIENGRIGLRLMPGRKSQFRNFRISTLPSTRASLPDPKRSDAKPAAAVPAETKQHPWMTYSGKEGPSQWKCHVIQADPMDDGPDGINLHDWDGDGDTDLLVNYEEGKYSRLYFNPGSKAVRDSWTDFVEFKHGKCEDSGMGDLDNDGDIDYIANGGWVYFNPGTAHVREASQWTRMTLFDEERRVPTVIDIDGDGLNDLVVGAQEWYQQPKVGKHQAKNWTRYTIG